MHTLREWGAQHAETLTYVPDLFGHPYAVRHALAPMFALQAYGGFGEDGQGSAFKWLLIGDDDTQW
ncbi:hypothetical protein GPECTOR_208g397 [Gonium pectorale]|uniref:Uncharacterized protein n=1 Tax=Gonium pectorale TaxID=33097 RepID=A0A150FY18_GONPE|nr:hypothetical protein GPECTOR_208g397 [Gonium pectorale]|eukprot:KXZ42085.1 hypothetical protein GPECTOR_208g397 [Gonium pectorale]